MQANTQPDPNASITIKLAIITLIVSVVIPFVTMIGQPLFARWLATRQRRTAMEKPAEKQHNIPRTRFRITIVLHTFSILFNTVALVRYLSLGDVFVIPWLACFISVSVSMLYFSMMAIWVAYNEYKAEQSAANLQDFFSAFRAWIKADADVRQNILDQIATMLEEKQGTVADTKPSRPSRRKKEFID